MKTIKKGLAATRDIGEYGHAANYVLTTVQARLIGAALRVPSR